MNRREFLRIMGGAGLAGPTLWGPSACAPVLTKTDPGTGLSLCSAAGEVTPESALIWLRAEEGSEVAIQYGLDPSFSHFFLTGPSKVDAQSDFTRQIVLEKLQPAKRYYYRAAVSGKIPGPTSSFITAPGLDDEVKVSFCFSGDTRESYKPFTIMDAVRLQRPDFFLYLGDTIYADRNGTARQLSEFWGKYRSNRDDPWLQRCLCETSLYVAWDDHEIEDNYLPGCPFAGMGRKAFLDYWPIRRSAVEATRIYRSFRWGKAMELFILDARQYRDFKSKTMLGKAQKEWLLNGLAGSQTTFKFIATTVPMSGGGSDRWDGFPGEREEIFHFIHEKKIRGVFFLSADLHYAAITKIPRSGGLKDITAGPLAAPVNRITNGTAKRFEYFLAENFNFAKITVDPKTDPTKATLEFIDQDNRVFHTAKLTAA